MTEPLRPAGPRSPTPPTALTWADAQRQEAFERWLAPLAQAHGLLSDSLRHASADASFRRYFRLDRADGSSCIIMDAPPEKEDCRPFVHVASLMTQAGLRVPQILAWDEAQGFMLLSDLGPQTLLQSLDPSQPQAALPAFEDALAALLAWQSASRPCVLPPYDEALLRRELQLFPDWYVAQHKGVAVQGSMADALAQTFATIVARNRAAPQVFVHRDFMPRNLVLPPPGYVPATRAQALGVLDFQDAVYGPITYDIASLLRDAFLSWEEEFVLEVCVRYWEKARKLGLLDFEDWNRDFSAFYSAVEWMGLQRHLKVLGIFARLTLRDGKPQYLADTPRFIHYVRQTALRYRALAPLLRIIDGLEGLQAASGWAFGRI